MYRESGFIKHNLINYILEKHESCPSLILRVATSKDCISLQSQNSGDFQNFILFLYCYKSTLG